MARQPLDGLRQLICSALGLFAEFLKGLECDFVARKIVCEGNRIKTEVRAGKVSATSIAFYAAALNMVDACGTKRLSSGKRQGKRRG